MTDELSLTFYYLADACRVCFYGIFAGFFFGATLQLLRGFVLFALRLLKGGSEND